jgi:hypothetical protein
MSAFFDLSTDPLLVRFVDVFVAAYSFYDLDCTAFFNIGGFTNVSAFFHQSVFLTAESFVYADGSVGFFVTTFLNFFANFFVFFNLDMSLLVFTFFVLDTSLAGSVFTTVFYMAGFRTPFQTNSNAMPSAFGRSPHCASMTAG